MINELKQYFKNIAQQHPKIRHSDTNNAFGVDTLSDLLDGQFKAKLSNKFSFRFVLPNFRNANNDMIIVETGFAILKKIQILKEENITTDLDETLHITTEVLARMIDDSRGKIPPISMIFNNLDNANLLIEPTIFEGDGSFVGQLITFQFEKEMFEKSYKDTLINTNWLDYNI